MNEMKELIDKQALLDALNKLCDNTCVYAKSQLWVMCGACPLEGAIDLVESFKPLKSDTRGTWEPKLTPGYYRCSVCDFLLDEVMYGYFPEECPNCKSKMSRY